MAIHAKMAMSGGRLPRRPWYRHTCVSSATTTAALPRCVRRNCCHLHHRQLVPLGMLLSALLILVRGETAAAPPAAFVGGCRLRVTAVSAESRGRTLLLSVAGGGGIGYDRDGVCLMATAGEDKEEEKMELAAEVRCCLGDVSSLMLPLSNMRTRGTDGRLQCIYAGSSGPARRLRIARGP